MSEDLKTYLEQLNYQAGGLASRLLALRFIFHGTNLETPPNTSEWIAIGDLVESLEKEASELRNALDCVTLLRFDKSER